VKNGGGVYEVLSSVSNGTVCLQRL